MDENADGGVVTSVATENATSVTVSDDRFEVADDNLKLKAGTMLDFESDDSPITVTITASGDGDSATHVVTVSIGDVNEDPSVTITPGAVVPEKTDAEGNPVTSSSTVAENALGSAIPPLALIEVMDPDEADEDMLTGSMGIDAITVSDDRFHVGLDPLNGLWLALNPDASLDYESTGGSVMVTVTFTDSAGNTAEATATVTVTDGNDDPVFEHSEYAFDLNENADGSTTAVMVGSVSATDEDAADTHAFSITAGNDDGLFAIDEASGAITYVGTGEDYRSSVTGPSHTLTVEVSDGTSTAEAMVAITILNVNEAPEFGESGYAFDLAENADGSTTAIDLGMVSATDSDEGDPVTYAIASGNDDGLFAIDAATGAITYVGAGEDAESGAASHELMVTASDGSASSEVMVTVNVTNANDSVPAFGESSYAFDLAENADGSATAVDVGMVSATDADGDTLEYSIAAGNDDGLFAIDSASGAITYVGAGEDAESDTTSHELTVEASDGTNSHSATVAVTVTDVNDAPMADAEMEIDTFALVNGTAGSMEVPLGDLFSDDDGDMLTYTLSSTQDWLNLSVTTSSDGSVTGRVHGTPPDDGNNVEEMVTIVATDGDATGEATFYVVVDAANAAPSSVTLRQTDGGVTSVVTAVTVAENADGASFGMVTVEDVDNTMHPHGQHDFEFEVTDEAGNRVEAAEELFEVDDYGMLKLKTGESLSFEDFEDEDGDATGKFTLTVTAMDRALIEPAEGEDPTTGSASMTLDVTLTNTADGPVANEIGDWWVTVDDRLDAEEARKGEWLSFVLLTTGEDAAFTDEDSETLEYSIAVADASGNAVDWLQIDPSTGAITNVAGMVPDEEGVYTVTVTAEDTEGNMASASFSLAVALADLDNSDNDRPDIRAVVDYEYTETAADDLDDSVRVASFEVRDEDIDIAPHPYGTLEVDFTATQDGGGNVKNRFKVVREDEDDFRGVKDDDPDTVQYEIHHKSAAELAVDDDGETLVDAEDNPDPIEPIDYEMGDEVEFAVTATDGQGDEDIRTVRVDIEDAADAAPVFSHADHKFDPETMMGTTTLTVDQQGGDVIVLRVDDEEDGVWSDPDTDADDLDIVVNEKDRDNLPDWVKVYGPDEREDIERRLEDGVELPGGTDDRDMVVVIVIDHSAATEADLEPGEGLTSFRLTATDRDGNSTTETISIDVDEINVGITEDPKNPVLTINGEPNGTGELTMDFDAAQDPNLSVNDDGEVVGAELVLYTWSIPAREDNPDTDDNETAAAVEMVSTSPQPFVLDTDGDMVNNYVGRQITATVKYYEVDPANDQIVASDEYIVTTKTIRAPEPGEGPSVLPSLDITTNTAGLSVDVVVANGDPTDTDITVRLESSTDGQSGWQRAGADVTNVDLTFVGTTGRATVPLPVDENDDESAGDGGGLHYRVVLTYGPAGPDQTTHTSRDVIQLGNVTVDPTTGNTDIIGVDPEADPVDQATVGEKILVNTDGAPAIVQWQIRANENMPWRNIEGATQEELEVDSAYAGMMLQARVTYTVEDDPETPGDETGWVTWVEYTEVGTVPGGTNDAPGVTDSTTKEIEVGLPAIKMNVQPGVTEMGDTDVLFHDPDNDPLTYSISIPSTDGTGFVAMELNTSDAGNAGSREEVLGGDLVYVTYETESVADPDNPGDFISQDVGEPQQTLAIDKDTGEITYFTNMSHGHDGNDGDGQGNILTFTVSATDNVTGNAAAEASVAVRINVAPTAIELQSASADDTTFGDAADLPPPSPADTPAADREKGTPLLVEDNTNTPVDDDNDPDELTFTDDERNDAQRVANIDVQDENATVHKFGTHDKPILTGRGAKMFEVKETTTDDTDGSTWEIHLKDGATFDYEALATTAEKATGNPITLSITITATDGGGLKTTGMFSVKLADAVTEDDPEDPADDPEPPAPAEDPATPGLKDDTDDSDEDGPVPPPEDENPEAPGDGGMFIDDLIDLHVEDDWLGDYVLAIDDIDVA